MIRRSSPAFTLIEMLMVMVIIAIIAGLVVGIAGYSQTRAARTRAVDEIHGMTTGCVNYEADNGSVPRESGTTEPPIPGPPSPISPILHGDPDAANYKTASLYLYQALSGDDDLDGNGGNLLPSGTPRTEYYQFNKTMLARIGTTTPPGPILYLRDPFGHSYGYSTSKAMAEQGYAQEAKTSIHNGTPVPRTAGTEGFNATFDLWSTAGAALNPPTDAVRMKWEKNW